ncbi:MAG: phytoene/squalene synthase family protein [Bacteroidota bacterium]
MDLYTRNSLKCSRQTTLSYSTSFSLGIRMLQKRYQKGIYAIYGFVRIADEIVDTFHDQPQKVLLEKFREETWAAIDRGFSTDLILHSFQWAVNTYKIDRELIEAFLYSMELDLTEKIYPPEMLKTYIYGSAEVVGLMCLRVFYHEQPDVYEQLIQPARKLGEAFQKVNFLRDAQDDYIKKGRVYFTNINFRNFTPESKAEIENDIQKDFDEAFQGIRILRKDVRFGVYLAYRYYLELLSIIRNTRPDDMLQARCRVPDRRKMSLLLSAGVRNALNLI